MRKKAKSILKPHSTAMLRPYMAPNFDYYYKVKNPVKYAP